MAPDLAQARISAMHALRFTGEVLPDLPPPQDGGFITGWFIEVACLPTGITVALHPAWSTKATHGIGHVSPGATDRAGKLTYMRPEALYSTRERANFAARHKVLMLAARELMRLDAELGVTAFAAHAA